VFGALLIVLGGAWLLDRVNLLTLEGRIILPLALAVVGVALMVGAFDGPHRGLLVTSGFLAVATIAATVVPLDTFQGGVGDRVHDISTQAQLAETYQLGAGDLRIDLRDLKLRQSATLQADLGAGSLTVIVPQGMAVEVKASVGAGQLTIFGQQWDGLGIQQTYRTPDLGPAGTTWLVLDLEVLTGQIEVRS
jgi:hypothetical protein